MPPSTLTVDVTPSVVAVRLEDVNTVVLKKVVVVLNVSVGCASVVIVTLVDRTVVVVVTGGCLTVVDGTRGFNQRAAVTNQSPLTVSGFNYDRQDQSFSR